MSVLPSNFGELLRPLLKDQFGLAYEAGESTFGAFYDKVDSVSAYEQFLQMSGIGLLRERSTGSDAEEDSPSEGYLITVEPSNYSLSMIIYKETLEQDKTGTVRKFPALLAKAARETEEVLAYTPLANGFTVTGWDSTYLFSDSHPYVGGGTWSNLLAATTLSLGGLSDMKAKIRRAKTNKNYIMRLSPEYLITVPEMEDVALELLHSTDRPDTPNRATNVMSNWLKLIVTPYLSSETAWFVTNKNVPLGMVYIDAYGMEQEVEYYKKKRGVEHIIHTRKVFTYGDQHAIYGCAGA